MISSIETFNRFRATGFREAVEVVEHKPARELVAARDITRIDGLGRTVVAVPMGQPPSSWLKLTAAEHASLVEPPPTPRQGHMHPGPYGFSPERVTMGGFAIDHPNAA